MTAPHVVTPADLPAPYSGPPLTLGYVGNFRHSFCTEVHVAGSLDILGHTVCRWQEDTLDWSTVVEKVQRNGVQLVMWTRTWPAEMDVVAPVLDELRQMGVPTVSFHLDRWFGLDRQHQVDDQPFFRTSVVVSPDDSPLWPEHGVNHFWLPPGVYGPECEPVAPNPRRWPYDVVFVGSHPYPHPEWAKYRSDLISSFSRAFRGRFGVLPRRGVPIRGRDLQELYATVPVVLGDSCLAGESHRYWSDRVPETLGRGGLLIHPMVDGMTPWYEGDEVTGDERLDFMGYPLGDFAEAVRLGEYGIDNQHHRGEAKGIRLNGRSTVLSRDTYAHRMGTVLAVAEGIHGGYRDVGEGTGWKIDDVRLLPDAVVEIKPDLSAWPTPPTPRHSVQLHRWSAIFEPRPGTTDSEVVGEVWRNDYKVPPGGFSGTVVDIGANVGAFSVLAAKAGAHRVYAFEPEAENRARLEHHIKINGVGDRVRVLAQAVTDGSSPAVDMVGTGGGARSVEGSSVITTTLSQIIAMYGPIEFCKVDAEGAEGAIFAAVPVDELAGILRLGVEWHGPDGPPGHPGAAHLQHLTGEEFGPLVTKLADAGRVETFGHPRRGGLLHWRAYGA